MKIERTGIKTTNPDGEDLFIRVVDQFKEVGLLTKKGKRFTRAIYIKKSKIPQLIDKLKEVL